MQKIELLAPAGDMEKMKVALRFGADTVYLGGPIMQLRAASTGFSVESLREAATYAHSKGRKVYVAVNAFAYNRDIDAMPDYASAMADAGVDAVIVSDPGVLRRIKRSVPHLDVHISTQANCLNYEAARVYYELGASRIVLGREMPLSDIRQLREKTPPELALEAFVHGAMCMSYSGRCMISAHLTGQSANRGDCKQSCRWRYALLEETRPKQFMEVYEDEKGTAILSAFDLSMLAHLDALIDAGITSFKIEGRMKTAYYVATITNAYRRALDKSAPASDLLGELNCVSHRPYSTGFYLGTPNADKSAGDGYLQSCLFAAVVLEDAECGRVLIEQRNKIREGDMLEVVSPSLVNASLKVHAIENEEGERLTSADVPMQQIRIDCPLPLVQGDMLRIRTGNA